MGYLEIIKQKASGTNLSKTREPKQKLDLKNVMHAGLNLITKSKKK